MNGILELEELLKNIHPEMSENDYVFCTVQSLSFEAASKLNPVCTFKEDEGISANVIAAYYHDHIFVPNTKSALALKVLQSLSQES